MEWQRKDKKKKCLNPCSYAYYRDKKAMLYDCYLCFQEVTDFAWLFN